MQAFTSSELLSCLFLLVAVECIANVFFGDLIIIVSWVRFNRLNTREETHSDQLTAWAQLFSTFNLTWTLTSAAILLSNSSFNPSTPLPVANESETALMTNAITAVTEDNPRSPHSNSAETRCKLFLSKMQGSLISRKLESSLMTWHRIQLRMENKKRCKCWHTSGFESGLHPKKTTYCNQQPPMRLPAHSQCYPFHR